MYDFPKLTKLSKLKMFWLRLRGKRVIGVDMARTGMDRTIIAEAYKDGDTLVITSFHQIET